MTQTITIQSVATGRYLGVKLPLTGSDDWPVTTFDNADSDNMKWSINSDLRDPSALTGVVSYSKKSDGNRVFWVPGHSFGIDGANANRLMVADINYLPPLPFQFVVKTEISGKLAFKIFADGKDADCLYSSSADKYSAYIIHEKSPKEKADLFFVEAAS